MALLTKSEKKLLKQYQNLPEQARQSLVDFCDFLSAQNPISNNQLLPPKDTLRPKDESVVLAMRRLSDTYFMLDKDDILNDASSLMSQHILQGRDSVEVIDELEVLFLKHYNALKELHSEDNK